MSVYVAGNTENPNAAVILLHGYGANGQDLLDLGHSWAVDFPEVVFIAPDAPQICEMSPMGYQWFSMADWSPMAMGAGAKRAAPWLDTFIDEQLAHYKIAENRLVLSGFSQGTMMALYLAVRRPRMIAGVLGFSGALVCAEEWPQLILQKPPICLVHGMNDTVVPVAAYYQAVQTLEAYQFAVTGHPLHGLMHGINQYGMDIGRDFLHQVL